MISVMLANAKGGCGKTTIATNLATAFANAGLKTALADGDRQHSCRKWLKRRPKEAPPIRLLDWRESTDSLPASTERLVIDSGAGLRSQQVRTLLKKADVLLMPVLPSLFDEKATRSFLKTVDTLKPIRRGKKPVVVVGNRLRANTRAEKELEAFLKSLDHSVGARIYDRALYQEVARQGLGVFDLTPARRAQVIDNWLPLVRLIESLA